MKAKYLLASVAVLAGLGGLGATQVKADTSSVSAPAGTTPTSLQSNATITFTQGQLSLLDVPNFDYGSHSMKTATLFQSVAGTPLANTSYDDTITDPAPDPSKIPSGATKIDRTKSSFLHVQDRSGSTTGWKVSVRGTVPYNGKDSLTGTQLNFVTAKNYWVDPTATSVALANDTVMVANTASVALDGATSGDIVSLASSTSAVENTHGGDYYTDFSPAGSTTLTVPIDVQKAGTFKSTLTWTLTAGVA